MGAPPSSAWRVHIAVACASMLAGSPATGLTAPTSSSNSTLRSPWLNHSILGRRRGSANGSPSVLLSSRPGKPVATKNAASCCSCSFVLALANKGWRRAMNDDAHLRDGLNVHDGSVTYRAVADALKLPYTHAEQALRL